MSNEWTSVAGTVEQHDGVLVIRRRDGELLMGDALLNSAWAGQPVRITIEVGAAQPGTELRSVDTATPTAMHLLTEALMLLRAVRPELQDGMAVHLPHDSEVQVRPIDYGALGALSQRDWQLASAVANEVTRRLEERLGKKNSGSRKKTGGGKHPRRSR